MGTVGREATGQFRHIAVDSQGRLDLGAGGGPPPGPTPVFERRYSETLELGTDFTGGRTSAATVVDHDGRVRDCEVGEIRMHGARRVRNTCYRSEDFNTWSSTGFSVFTPGQPDPYGALSRAQHVRAAGANASIKDNRNPVDVGHTVRCSVWIRRVVGSGTILALTGKNDSETVDITSLVTGSWKRLALGAVIVDQATQTYGFELVTLNDEVELFGFQREIVSGQSNQAPGDYVGVNSPYFSAVVGVDGVKYFGTENGNSVVGGEVVESAGTPISLDNMGLASNELKGFTNRFLNSEDASLWDSQNCDVSVNQGMSPDGRMLADKVAIDASGTVVRGLSQSISFTLAPRYYTQSFYVKKVERSWVQLAAELDLTADSYQNFNLDTGAKGASGTGQLNAGIWPMGDGWYRISLTVLSTVVGLAKVSLVLIDSDVAQLLPASSGTVGDGVLVWGGQFEDALTATSYIRTGSGQVSNANEEIKYSLTTPQTEGMLIFEVTNFDFVTEDFILLVASFTGAAGSCLQFQVPARLASNDSDGPRLLLAYTRWGPPSKCIYALNWGALARTLQLKSASSGVWDETSGAFAGSWHSQNLIRISNGQGHIFSAIRAVSIYDTDEGAQWIKDNFNV